MNERDFVQKAALGDKDAYSALIDAYQGMVFAVALNITRDYTESEDIVQEAFLQAWENLPSLYDPAKFVSWLYTLTKRLALKFLKQKGRIAASIDEDVDIEQIDAAGVSPEDSAAQKEINALLWGQVNLLPAKTREAILLYYVEGFSTVRAAEFLGIDEAAFRMRLAFGREKLRNGLMDKIEGELKRHQPGEKRRNAILTALPLLKMPKAQIEARESSPPKTNTATSGKIQPGQKPPFSFLKGSMPRIVSVLFLVSICVILYLLFQHHRQNRPDAPENITIKSTRNRTALAEQTIPSKETPAPPNAKAIASSREPVFLLKGSVIEKETGLPIRGIRITLKKENRTIGQQLTNTAGVFEFPGLPNGIYRIFLEPGDPATTEFYLYDTYINGITTRIAGRNMDALTVPLKSVSYITGRVVDMDNRPVENAEVYMIGKREKKQDRESSLFAGRAEIAGFDIPGKSDTYYIDNEKGTVRTGSDGSFKFSALPPDHTYHIGCTISGYCMTTVENIVLKKGAAVENIIVQTGTDAGATVSGRAVNEDGLPLEGIWIKAAVQTNTDGSPRYPPSYEASFMTDENGMFCFRGVPQGMLTIQEFLTGWPDHVELEIPSSQQNLTQDLVVKGKTEEGIISGRIVDETGRVLKGGIVYALDKMEQKNHGVGLVQNDGRFRILHIPVNKPINLNYAFSKCHTWNQTNANGIKASAENLTVKRYFPYIPLWIPRDKPVSQIKVRGRVRDQQSLHPVEFFSVQPTLSYAAMDFPFWFYDAEGRFELDRFAYHMESENNLKAAAGEYRDNVQDVKRIPGQEIPEIEFLMRNKPLDLVWEGTVVNSRGEPVSSAEISVNSAGAPDSPFLSDANGKFQLRWECLDRPSYAVLTVFHPDYAQWTRCEWNFTKGYGEGDIHIADYEIRLSSGGTLQGIVLDETGKGLPHCEISFESISGDGSTSRTITGEDGRYFRDRIQPGGYYITAYYSYGYYRSYNAKQIVYIKEGEVSTLNFTMQGSTLYGIISGGGKPLCHIFITLSDSEDPKHPSALSFRHETDDSGKYEITGIPQGNYYLILEGNQKCIQTIPLEIPAQQKIEKNIIFQYGSIRGKVVQGAESIPLPGMNVGIYQRDIMSSMIPGMEVFDSQACSMGTSTDSKGQFEFKDVIPGDYTLEGIKDDSGWIMKDITIEPGQTLNNVILVMKETGSIEIRALDADTGKDLALMGSLMLKYERERVIEKHFREYTPQTIAGISVGSYSPFGIMSDPDNRRYISEVQEEISVEAGKTTPVHLKMREGVEIEIEVFDSAGKPVSGFQAFTYDANGAWYPMSAPEGNFIKGLVPAGEIRLVLMKSGERIYDNTIQIAPPGQGGIFNTKIIVE